MAMTVALQLTASHHVGDNFLLPSRSPPYIFRFTLIFRPFLTQKILRAGVKPSVLIGTSRWRDVSRVSVLLRT